MKLNDKNSPIKAYAAAGQIGGMVIVPLLLFIGGGNWLVNKLNLPNWSMIIFIALGIFIMVCTVASYLRNLFAMYDDLKEKKAPMFDKRDYDFFE